MSVMKELHAKAERNLKSQSGKNKTKNRAGVMVGTDFALDMEKLYKDLTARKIVQIAERISTQIRKTAVRNLKRGSTADRVGRSQYNKKTRGDWQNPRTSISGKQYLKGGWHGKVLKNRGANKPTMAYNGGSTSDRTKVNSGGVARGSRGIITKMIGQRNGGTRAITGPRYSADDSDNGKYGYNYAHTLEHGATIAAYGNKERRVNMKARPFLGPAGEQAYAKNNQIVNDMLKKWGKGQ